MSVLNAKSVEETKATMKDKFPIMIKYFMEDMTTHLGSIKEGIAENNAEKIKLPAHTIKSSAKLIGGDNISELANQIEDMASDILNGKKTEIAKIIPVVEQLQQAYDYAQPELKSLL